MKSIIDYIEDKIQELAKQEWKTDDCPPEFWVSLYNTDMHKQKIILTINHNGVKFSDYLFPTSGTEYGYESVLFLMKSMYNQTM